MHAKYLHVYHVDAAIAQPKSLISPCGTVFLRKQFNSASEMKYVGVIGARLISPTLETSKISICSAFPAAPKQCAGTGEFHKLGGCLCVPTYVFWGVYNEE